MHKTTMMALKIKRFLFKIYLNLPGTRYIFSLIKRFYIPPYRWRKYLRFRGVFTLTIDNFCLRVMSHGNTIENELFWLGSTGWEGRATKVWKMLSEESKIIFDVGANTGLYSLISSHANSSATVYAFEPVDLIFKRLKKNIELNRLKVNLNKIALADEDGEGRIFVADTVSNTFDQASLNDTLSRVHSNYFTISKMKLSSFITQHKIVDIDLMKIDVESFEPQVLGGMGFYLKEFAPTLLIEILNNEVAKRVEALISDIDYQYYLIDEQRGYIHKNNLCPGKRGNNFLLLNQSKHPNFQITATTEQ